MTSKHQVAIVEVAVPALGTGLFLDGNYLYSVEPGCSSDLTALEAVAAGLASLYQVKIERLNYPSKQEEWSDIRDELLAQAWLIPFSDPLPALTQALQGLLPLQAREDLADEFEPEFNEARNALRLVGALEFSPTEYSIEHEVLTGNGKLETRLLNFQAENYSFALEQLFDHYSDLSEKVIRAKVPEEEDTPCFFQRGDSDLILSPVENSSIWVEVGTIAIHIVREDLGVSIYAYPYADVNGDAIAENYAYYGAGVVEESAE